MGMSWGWREPPRRGADLRQAVSTILQPVLHTKLYPNLVFPHSKVVHNPQVMNLCIQDVSFPFPFHFLV